ncbi:hypothetical protein PRIPAC_91885 [Pristionchus pacificus]|uniref:Uncharacterized protein n=1 Tax=Pristionchus pacificus TaxID=54126 RepID=A0A2A6BAY2_PRIPA|nr:hypothetical protein PRIPAC_91885 [Pristionchus pacificus]|eukprot:PDM63045.1 hypothetical protein PRIPAC_50260 [Pristionchus pacificus]
MASFQEVPLHSSHLSLRNSVAPQLNCPYDEMTTIQWKKNNDIFENSVRFWTQHYANGTGEKNAELVRKIVSLMEIGVCEVRDLLADSN